MSGKRSHAIPTVEWSGGNVFADLGFKNPDLRHVKATLVAELSAVIAKRKLSQRQVAKVLDVDQPKISALLRGHFSGFSTDRLLRFLTAMGQDVEIIVRTKRKRQRSGRIQVTAA